MEQAAYQTVSVTLVRTFGVVLCSLIVLAAGLTIYSTYVKKRKYPDRPLPNGLSKPVLALELVKSRDEVEMVLGDGEGESSKITRNMMKEDLKGDSYVFIPIYWLLLITMSWLLTRRQFNWATWAGIAAGVSVTGAAIFDYLENAGIRAVLDKPIAEITDQMALAIRRPSLVKWALIFIAMGLLAAIFWQRNWIMLLAVAYLLIAIIGLAGLIYHPAIEKAFALMGIIIIPVALLFTFWPKQFLREF